MYGAWPYSHQGVILWLSHCQLEVTPYFPHSVLREHNNVGWEITRDLALGKSVVINNSVYSDVISCAMLIWYF